jgi:hypothetical protein
MRKDNKMTTKLTGSCLCGSVKYTTTADFEMSGNCHCKTCKRMMGGAFLAVAVIDEKSFDLVQGADAIVRYEVTERLQKNFCGTCGTPIFNQHTLIPGKALVYVGSLDDPSRVVPTFNIHCENMLPWVPSIASLKSFDQGFTKS